MPLHDDLQFLTIPLFQPLASRGFSLNRQGNVLGRWCGDRFEQVYIHRKKNKAVMFIGGLAFVGFKSVAQFLKKCSAAKYYSTLVNTATPICAHQAFRDSRGSQWQITPDTDCMAVGQEILEDCFNDAFPFFERISTIPALISHLKDERFNKCLFDQDHIQLAAALWTQGHQNEAIESLERLVEVNTYALADEPRPAALVLMREQLQVVVDVLEWFKGLERAAHEESPPPQRSIVTSMSVDQNDIARRVAIAFEEFIDKGFPVGNAMEKTIESHADQLDDVNFAPHFWLALARIGLTRNCLTKAIRDIAIAVIESRQCWKTAEAWEPESERREAIFLRRLALNALKNELHRQD